MFKRTVARSPFTRNSIFSKIRNLSLFPVRDIPQRGRKRISHDGNEQEKGALEEKKTAQGPGRKTEREKQSGSESVGETRRPSLSKSRGQYERG